MNDGGILLLVVTIFALGIISQIIADKYKVPSILFLIIAGVIFGPEVLNIINPEAFGDGIQTIIGLSVAIIVFEGAFHLKLTKLKAAQSEAIRLGTLGAVFSCIATAVVAYYTLNVPWDISFLIGALLVATGPTVIKPIMEVVPVRQHVQAALETEGIVNDVTAAIMAIVVFEFVIIESKAFDQLVSHFFTRLGSGVLVGIIVALAAWYLIKKVDLDSPNEVQDARIVTIGAALLSYGLAEMIISEAGIAAVATAGIMLGNMEIPYKEEIKEFEDTITVLVISFVFITLTALLSFDDLVALGLGGILFVLAVTLIVRPLTVYMSTKGETFSTREKAYISLVGPRGIIPASVATLFALELQQMGYQELSATLVGSVFLVIFATSFIEGGLARHIAEKLEVIPMHIVIVGAGEAGLELAEKLQRKGENTVIIEKRAKEVEKARHQGFNAVKGDARDIEILEKAGIDKAKILATVTRDDDANLVVAQMAKSKHGVENIISRVNDPVNEQAFRDMGVELVSSPSAVADAIDNTIERPALWNQITEFKDQVDIQEITLNTREVNGLELEDFERELPEGCAVTLVTRNSRTVTPERDLKLRKNDRLTVTGRKEAVEEVLSMYGSEPARRKIF